ncbi:MAG: EscU/YscU/HrcU family type III secretion system export apparatus switch protein [Polyangiaceae bacterium]|nr:EscU/YscU/HrcU family type III secretion system export apparatus switch protein [Polyangiaceae bacterium]
MSDEAEDKELDPTPERRRKAREEGRLARARDAAATLGQVAVIGLLVATAGTLALDLADWARLCFTSTGDALAQNPLGVGRQAAMQLARLALPAAFVAAAAATLVGVVEAGFQPNFDLLAPKWERLDVFSKLPELFSPKAALGNVSLSLVRVALVGAVAYASLSSNLPVLAQGARASLVGGALAAADVALRLMLHTSGALLVASALDFGWSWWRLEQSLKMSPEEMKEEVKQQEGNPQVRAKQRQRAKELARRALAKEVKASDVVITNPTHVAVALRYRAQEGAPVVTAKGYDDVAQHIKKLARDHGVPTVENVPLARALAEGVRVGRPIPAVHYAAVARVLAFVYRQRRGRRA